MKKPEYFDILQHLREWWRYVLPIFVVVTAILMIVFLVYRSPTDENNQTESDAVSPARNGLLFPSESALFDPAFAVLSPMEMVSAPQAVRFDAPLGSPHGAMAYNAQPFLTDQHLGDDLNGIGGWDSDLGDPVYAASDGVVFYAGWPSDGWGNVITLLHELPDGRMIETFYGHLDVIRVPVGKQVRRGDVIGTVGTANGRYLAHLHFEIRRFPSLDIGAGYADHPMGRMSGELSLVKWRNCPDDLLAGPPNATAPGENEVGTNFSKMK